MRLYGAFTKAEVQSDGTVRVEGIASSEAEDDQGETVQAEAMRAAIPDYMRFPALREMHQLSAAGTTLEADVGDDGVTRIVGHVVDPVAVTKIRNQVYRGFSIGGQVTGRDPSNRKIITALKLNEISLVDRPANPEAIFDCWKAGGAIIEGTKDMPDGGLATIGEIVETKKAAAEPIQVWACGIADHRHLAKADAARCLDDGAVKAAGPAEGATATETDPGPDAAAEGETAAPTAPAEAQSALEMARAAVERGEAVLARAGANIEPAPASVEPDPAESADGDPAAKGGDQPGDGSKPYGDETYAEATYANISLQDPDDSCLDTCNPLPITNNAIIINNTITSEWGGSLIKIRGGTFGEVHNPLVQGNVLHAGFGGTNAIVQDATTFGAVITGNTFLP